jgi:hypothetical protein
MILYKYMITELCPAFAVAKRGERAEFDWRVFMAKTKKACIHKSVFILTIQYKFNFMRYFMSFYFSPFRFSSFLLTTSLLMSSSVWAMERDDSSQGFGSGFRRGFLSSPKPEASPAAVAGPAMKAAPSPVPLAAKLDDSSAEKKQPHNITDSAVNGGSAQTVLPSSKDSSGEAMERAGELLQPGDEGYSIHVAAWALDIAPASAAAAAAAAAAPAAAAAFDDNNRQGAGVVEGFSPAVLGDFQRDFPVEEMRQWEASFRHFADVFGQYCLAIKRIGPFASAPLMKEGRFKAWGLVLHKGLKVRRILALWKRRYIG